MSIFLQISLFVLLFITAYQDFKSRAIWWGLIPLLTIVIGILGFQDIGQYLLQIWLINILFFGFQLFVLTLYFSWKNKTLTNITNQQLGLGDILFFIPLSGLFSLRYLILFLIVMLLISIIAALILLKQRQNIPLAGIFAVGLIVILSLKWLNIMEINQYF